MKVDKDTPYSFDMRAFDRKSGEMLTVTNCLAFDDSLGYGIFYDLTPEGRFAPGRTTHIEWHDWELVIMFDWIREYEDFWYRQVVHQGIAALN